MTKLSPVRGACCCADNVASNVHVRSRRRRRRRSGPKVAAAKAVAEEAYAMFKKGRFSQHKLEDMLKKMNKEGAYWGTIAGVYVGMKNAMERICSIKDWKNAVLRGALTGALVSAATNSNHDWEKIAMDAITGGAIATAAELLKCLTE